MKTTLKPHLRAGFTLIETTIALGIAIMGITSVLGLLPQCLEQLNKAGDYTAEARITQQITSAISQADWQDASGADALAFTFNGRRYFYDNLAQEVGRSGTDGALDAASLSYVAEVRVDGTGYTVPGGSADPNLRRIRIRVKNTPVANVDFDNLDARTYRTFSTLISKTGR